jgi:hypothetical protein
MVSTVTFEDADEANVQELSQSHIEELSAMKIFWTWRKNHMMKMNPLMWSLLNTFQQSK